MQESFGLIFCALEMVKLRTSIRTNKWEHREGTTHEQLHVYTNKAETEVRHLCLKHLKNETHARNTR